MNSPEPSTPGSQPCLSKIDLGRAETLDISKHGDGRQRIMKVPCGDTFIILKCYGRKRSRLSTMTRQFGNFIGGQSSMTAQGRRDTELAVLKLWQREGFDAPEVYDLAEPPPEFPFCLAMEYISGPPMVDVLWVWDGDGDYSLADKKEIVARYARSWGARHARALELKEPRLLQAHPSLRHVFYANDRLVHFDFEVVFTGTKNLDRLIRREIVGVLRSMSQVTGEQFEPLLNTLLDNYPDLDFFRQTARELSRYGTVPEMGWTAVFYRLMQGRKRYKKRRHFIETLEKTLARRSQDKRLIYRS